MTHPLIQTRIATEADDRAILAIEAVSWDSSSGFPSMREPKDSAFNERTTPANYVLAELDGKVVGYSRLMNKTPIPENGHVKGIYGLAVLPEARGHGVASKLLEASADEARRQGARKISLAVFGTNEPAQRLYAKHGYFEEGRSKDEYLIDGAYVDNIMLAKVL